MDLVATAFWSPRIRRSITFGLIGPITAWAVVTCFATSAVWGRVVVLAALTLTLAASHGHLERGLQPIFPWVTAAHPIGVLLLVGWLVVQARHWQSATVKAPHDAVPPAAGQWAQAA